LNALRSGSSKHIISDIVTRSPEETMAFGRQLARQIERPGLVLLEGDLGTGKTTLVKGMVSGIGAAREEEVNSPTFTLVHEYGKENKVYHVDLYRIDDPGELASLGLEDLMAQNAIVIVEWGEKLGELGFNSGLRIRLEHLGNDDRRILVESLEA
jgi:tRNA threonylcarbamoyladenosine biosynthesis protein TsaE